MGEYDAAFDETSKEEKERGKKALKEVISKIQSVMKANITDYERVVLISQHMANFSTPDEPRTGKWE